jgi:hypothetical protein
VRHDPEGSTTNRSETFEAAVSRTRTGIRFRQRSSAPRWKPWGAHRGRLPVQQVLVEIAAYDHTGLTPGPISIAGFAPVLGTNFCARPLSTSATYRLPS